MNENCCLPQTEKTSNQEEFCPQCHQKGKPIGIITVKAQLTIPLYNIKSAKYYFCNTRDCEVVYYSTDEKHVIKENEIQSRVYQKHPDDEQIFVCYCFRYTVEMIKKSRESVIKEITAGVKAGQCACEIKNPQGSCCLGNVRKVIKETTLSN